MKTGEYYGAREIDALLSQPWVTIDQLAVVLGVSRGTAFALVKRGEVKAFRIGRRLLRVPTEPLRRMMELEGGKNAEQDSEAAAHNGGRGARSGFCEEGRNSAEGRKRVQPR